MILLPIRGLVNSENYLANKIYTPFSIDRLPADLNPYTTDFNYSNVHKDMPKRGALWNFAYQPNDSVIVNKMMAKVSKKLHLNMIR